MKFNKLFGFIATAILFFPVQPTYAWLTKCRVGPDYSNQTIVSCGSDAAGGYVTVKNVSPISSPKTIRVSPHTGASVVLKRGDTSPLYFLISNLVLDCDGCTSKNAAVTVVRQCSLLPTDAELRQSTCK